MYIIILAISIWGLTSIVKIPAFLGLLLSYAILFVIIWKRDEFEKAVGNIAISFLASAGLLAYCLSNDIYPVNFSVLISGLLAYGLLNSREALGKRGKKLWVKFKILFKADKFATIVFVGSFIIVLCAGSYFSLGVGLTWDERVEQQTFTKALVAIGLGLSGDGNYYDINKWGDRYYGVGFYLPFYFVHRSFVGLITSGYNVSLDAAILLSRHLAVFWFFAFSSLIVTRIVYLLTDNLRYAYLISIAYLVCPYFLGHGMTNVKDTPFACVWLISLCLLLGLVKSFLDNVKFSKGALIALVLSVGWLITIRVSGVLFFVPLLIALIILRGQEVFAKFQNMYCYRGFLDVIFHSENRVFKKISFILCSLLVFVTLFYPVAWQDPSELFKAVRYMSKHPWGGCTLTFGDCMVGGESLYTYIPAWLIVKLPFVALLGVVLLPIILFSRSSKPTPISKKLIFLVALSAFLIPAILVLKRTVLYDELRQILFVVTMFFIIGAASLFYVNKPFAMAFFAISIVVFSIDNVKLYPYQLSWFNEPSRLFNLNGKYETDYWGSGLARLAGYMNKHDDIFNYANCIYADPDHLLLPFINSEKYKCVKPLSEVFESTPRPFAYAKYERSFFKGMRGCKVVHVESRPLLFSSSDLKLGEVGICE